MASYSGTFTAAGQTSSILMLGPKEVVAYTVEQSEGNDPFIVVLEEMLTGDAAARAISTISSDTGGSVTHLNDTTTVSRLRFRSKTVSSGDEIDYTLEDVAGELTLLRYSNPNGEQVFALTDDGHLTATAFVGKLLTTLPLSAAGLAPGDLWNDEGVVKVVSA